MTPPTCPYHHCKMVGKRESLPKFVTLNLDMFSETVMRTVWRCPKPGCPRIDESDITFTPTRNMAITKDYLKFYKG